MAKASNNIGKTISRGKTAHSKTKTGIGRTGRAKRGKTTCSKTKIGTGRTGRAKEDSMQNKEARVQSSKTLRAKTMLGRKGKGKSITVAERGILLGRSKLSLEKIRGKK